MSNTAVNDGTLYRRFLAGEQAAYDQLMIRYGDSLTFYLYGYLHDWHDAEDLMIEAFARIMVKQPQISDGAFKAYLFKTGRNLAARFYSKRTRIVQFSLDEWGGDIEDTEILEEKVLDKEKKEVLQLCLEKIDPQVREALWLVYMEEMTYAEVATVMKVKVKKVDYLLQKGKKQMRQELEKERITDADR